MLFWEVQSKHTMYCTLNIENDYFWDSLKCKYIIYSVHPTMSIILPKHHTDSCRITVKVVKSVHPDSKHPRRRRDAKEERAKPSLSTTTLITEHYSLLVQIWRVKMLANWETCRIFQAGRNLLMRPFFQPINGPVEYAPGLVHSASRGSTLNMCLKRHKSAPSFIFTSYRGLSHSARSNLQTASSVPLLVTHIYCTVNPPRRDAS